MCEDQESILKAQGDPESRGRCERVIKDIGTAPLNYFVAFHKDGVKQATFVDLPSAWMFYEAVSTNWAKLIMDKTSTQESHPKCLLEITDDNCRQLYWQVVATPVNTLNNVRMLVTERWRGRMESRFAMHLTLSHFARRVLSGWLHSSICHLLEPTMMLFVKISPRY